MGMRKMDVRESFQERFGTAPVTPDQLKQYWREIRFPLPFWASCAASWFVFIFLMAVGYREPIALLFILYAVLSAFALLGQFANYNEALTPLEREKLPDILIALIEESSTQIKSQFLETLEAQGGKLFRYQRQLFQGMALKERRETRIKKLAASVEADEQREAQEHYEAEERLEAQ